MDDFRLKGVPDLLSFAGCLKEDVDAYLSFMRSKVIRQSHQDLVTLSNADDLLLKLIEEQTNKDQQLWSSPNRSRRDSTHAFFQYPAMMVPTVQKRLVEIIVDVQPNARSIMDPFVGAGTSLVSAMHQGLDCYGQDINPLAVLLARTRTGPQYCTDIGDCVSRVIRTVVSDTSTKLEADFPNLRKWFEPDVAGELSKLRRAIRKEEVLWVRRFLWITLAETVRLTSNDRTSTYKLHARPNSEVSNRKVAPIDIFSSLAKQNVDDLIIFTENLEQLGCLQQQRYISKVNIALHDTVMGIFPVVGKASQQFDLLVTSPPYGDNTTTVPYGQHSYLPLQWIDFEDIDILADPSCLRTTHEIDRKSLGGQRSNMLETDAQLLGEQSPSLAHALAQLQSKPIDRMSRVVSFYRDFVKSLDHVINSLRDNAYMVWTVGNRTVGGVEIRNDQVLSDFLELRGVKKVAQIERKIHFKRMAVRNGIASTMGKERIIIFRKYGGNDNL